MAALKVHNEHQKRFEQGFVDPDEPIPFGCECGDVNCYDAIELTVAQLDAAHASKGCYVVKPHHIMPDYELVAARYADHWVVQKYAPWDTVPERHAMQRLLDRLRRTRPQTDERSC